MDSHVLAELFDYVADQRLQVHSIAVVRNDHLVLEAYFHPIRPDHAHHIGSSTKSITSALVGIAIDRGILREVDQPVLSLLEGRGTADSSELKRRVKLFHLLTMSSGFDWPTVRFWEQIAPEWDASSDPVQFVLDRPMKHEPGTEFNYNSGNAHVVSAVIQEAAGMSAATFAKQYLFEPLGISNVIWPSDKNGVSWGGGRVMMTTRDMLKIGLLYLNDGAFAGEQIIPSAWIKASSTPHVSTFYGDDSYGYMWWIDPSGRYRSLGALGQCIYVMPHEEIVMAVTGGLGLPHMEEVPDRLVESFILPAVKSAEPLPEDPVGVALLRSKIESVTHPEAHAIPAMPDMATEVANRRILLERPLIGVEALRFDFDVSSAAIRFSTGTPAMAIGLDAVHRVADAGPLGEPNALVGLKGRWEDDDSFFLHIVFLHGARFDTLWHFDASGVSVEVEEPLASYRIRGSFQD